MGVRRDGQDADDALGGAAPRRTARPTRRPLLCTGHPWSALTCRWRRWPGHVVAGHLVLCSVWPDHSSARTLQCNARALGFREEAMRLVSSCMLFIYKNIDAKLYELCRRFPRTGALFRCTL